MDNIIVIKLTKNQTSIIDQDKTELIKKYNWQAQERSDKKGWYVVSRGGIRMHRLLMNAKKGEIVDHINGNGLDNRIINLRIGNQSLNSINRKITPGKFLRGTRPKKKKWQAYLKHKGKTTTLGHYFSEQEAHEVYKKESRKLHGDWFPL